MGWLPWELRAFPADRQRLLAGMTWSVKKVYGQKMSKGKK